MTECSSACRRRPASLDRDSHAIDEIIPECVDRAVDHVAGRVEGRRRGPGSSRPPPVYLCSRYGTKRLPQRRVKTPQHNDVALFRDDWYGKEPVS